jgi:hypothetical protein
VRIQTPTNKSLNHNLSLRSSFLYQSQYHEDEDAIQQKQEEYQRMR